jgi:hypothetical protein
LQRQVFQWDRSLCFNAVAVGGNDLPFSEVAVGPGPRGRRGGRGGRGRQRRQRASGQGL